MICYEERKSGDNFSLGTLLWVLIPYFDNIVPFVFFGRSLRKLKIINFVKECP